MKQMILAILMGTIIIGTIRFILSDALVEQATYPEPGPAPIPRM